MKDFFDFSDNELREAYVEESLVADVQHDIVGLMKAKGVSRAELARRLRVSAPYVSQILGDEDANLTLRTIARVYDALGERATISSSSSSARGELETKSLKSPVGRDWSQVAPDDRWSCDFDLAKFSPAANQNDCVVVWLDAVNTRRSAARA